MARYVSYVGGQGETVYLACIAAHDAVWLPERFTFACGAPTALGDALLLAMAAKNLAERDAAATNLYLASVRHYGRVRGHVWTGGEAA
jgi:hypothetical protein